MWIQRRGYAILEALKQDLLGALDNDPDVWDLGFPLSGADMAIVTFVRRKSAVVRLFRIFRRRRG